MPMNGASPTTRKRHRAMIFAGATALAITCSHGAAAQVTSTASGSAVLSDPFGQTGTASGSQNSVGGVNNLFGTIADGSPCSVGPCNFAQYQATYTNRPVGLFSLQAAVEGGLMATASTSGSAAAGATVAAFDTLLLTGNPGDHREVTLHKTLSLTEVQNLPSAFVEGEGSVFVQQSLRIESEGIGSGPGGDDRFAFGSYSAAGAFQQTSLDTIDFNLNLMLGQPKDIEILMSMASDIEDEAKADSVGSGGFDWEESLTFLDGLSVTDTLTGQAMCGLTISSRIDYGSVAACPAGSGAVPEPASWALMILGFGGVGAMLRRRFKLVGPT
jgi:hypothetical protein